MKTNASKDKAWKLTSKTWMGLCLFMLLALCYTYTLPRWADPSQNSRLDMVVAVVDDGTFQIDPYVANTVDYAKVGEHYYSDKAPGPAFIGIPVYAALRRLLDLPVMDNLMAKLLNNQALAATLNAEGTGILKNKVGFAIAQGAVTIVTAVIPTAMLGVLMFYLLKSFTHLALPRLIVVLGYGLLTPVFAYANAFYGHQLSAACLFAAFYLVFKVKKPLTTTALLSIGLLLGYSVISDYPTVLVVGVLFLYTLSHLSDKRRIGWVILTGGIIAAGLMVYNTLIFGGPFSLGYGYSELWQDQHETGFMSLTLPHWEAIWGITFGKFRGLFVLSPFLLLTIPGFVFWWRAKVYRREFWVSLTAIIAMFLFNASSIMWWGGFAIGPRYLLSMLPFMCLPIVFTFESWGQRPWFRFMASILMLWSFIATWGLTLAGQAFPPDTLRNPLLMYALPNWQSGNIARNLGMFLGLPGIISLAPLLIMVIVLLAVLYFLSNKVQNPAMTPISLSEAGRDQPEPSRVEAG